MRKIEVLGDFNLTATSGWLPLNSFCLALPTNIEIIYLPPYSPELNPVERLWNYFKNNTIKNRFYNSIAALERIICGFLRKISNQTIISVCSCDYMSN